jgi:mannitol-specific phosphotransferase system IIBC component
MEKSDLDFILVPLGLALMVGYHLWLLHRIIHQPTKTVIGTNAINRRIWIETIMEVYNQSQSFFFFFVISVDVTVGALACC